MGTPRPSPPLSGRLFLLLLTLLSLLLDTALASLSSNGIDDTTQTFGPSGSSSGSGSGSGTGTGSGGSGSTDIIGGQPATVQLGSGFIVGCVIGVILYTVVRLSMRVVKSTLADTRRNRGEEANNNAMREGVLVEV